MKGVTFLSVECCHGSAAMKLQRNAEIPSVCHLLPKGPWNAVRDAAGPADPAGKKKEKKEKRAEPRLGYTLLNMQSSSQ